MLAFNGYQQSKDFCFFRKHPTLLGPFTNGDRLVIRNGKEESESRCALYISCY